MAPSILRCAGAVVLTIACLPGIASGAEPIDATCAIQAATTPRDLQRVADKLEPGDTWCVGPGVYTGDLVIRHGGTADEPVTLRAYPERAATIYGQLRIADGADFVHVADFKLAGPVSGERPSPLVNGDDSRFTGNDVTSSVDSCFVLGDKVWGIAERTAIVGNRIHDCGVSGTNKDHGVYVRQAVDTLVEQNLIEHNPDRGVQLYPNADRTVVKGNLIDRNGEGVIFSGDSTDTSDRNLVVRNIITGSLLRWDVESYWWSRRGRGNVVRRNCVAGGARGAIQRPAIGFVTKRNVLLRSACGLSAPSFP